MLDKYTIKQLILCTPGITPLLNIVAVQLKQPIFPLSDFFSVVPLSWWIYCAAYPQKIWGGRLKNTREKKPSTKTCRSQPGCQEIARFRLAHAVSCSLSFALCCSHYFFLPCLISCRKSWGHQHVTNGTCILTSIEDISFYGAALQLDKTSEKPLLPNIPCGELLW